jgi:hypothetical protein
MSNNAKASYWIMVIAALLLPACGPSAADIQRAIEQTQAAIPTSTPIPTAPAIPPTPTATPVPLADIDLEPLLIHEGDLPAGFSGAQIWKRGRNKTDKLYAAVNSIYQQFDYNGKNGGGVAVYLFEGSEDLGDAFAALERLADTAPPVESLGDQSFGNTIDMSLIGKAAYVTFVRCQALVEINFEGTSSLVDAVGYALRLDRRLAEVVCR